MFARKSMSVKEKIIQKDGLNGHANGQENYLALGGVIYKERYAPRRERGMAQFRIDARIHELRMGLREGRIYPPAYYGEIRSLRRLRRKFNKSEARTTGFAF